MSVNVFVVVVVGMIVPHAAIICATASVEVVMTMVAISMRVGV